MWAVVVVEESAGSGWPCATVTQAARGGRSFLREEGLTGELFEIAKEDYDALRNSGYPSLFVVQRKYYILPPLCRW